MLTLGIEYLQDVRSKISKTIFDLGGAPSTIVKGIHRFNTYDVYNNLIAVNVCPAKSLKFARLFLPPLHAPSVLRIPAHEYVSSYYCQMCV